MLLPLALGFILGIVHYASEWLHLLGHARRMRVVSFTGGVFLSYLVLHLLPQLFTGNAFLDRVSLLSVLAGFSLFHLAEKHIYRHEAKSPEELRRELKEAHAIAFFAYHFILGIALVNVIARAGLAAGLLFFIPLLLIAAMSSLSLKAVHGQIRQRKAVKLLLSASTLLGMAAASAFPLTPLLYGMLFGFVVGALFFVAIVDSIPRERKGEPLFFILGAALYSLLIGVTWLF